MIARISIYSADGTLYSYLSESEAYVGKLPVKWQEGEEAPSIIVDVLAAISRSDVAPPFLSFEAIIKVTIEEETEDSWVAQRVLA